MEYLAKSSNANIVPTTTLLMKAEPILLNVKHFSDFWFYYNRMNHALNIYGCKYISILILALNLLESI